MKALYIGGVKSGKSKLAEARVLQLAGSVKPFYLATTELLDEEMQARVKVHRERRADLFDTIEEPVKLHECLKNIERPVLVECVTLWINNCLYHGWTEADIFQALESVMRLPCDVVLVHNEVGMGIIPDNALARQFVDLSGKAAQLMAGYCDEVYFCSAGLALRMK